MLDNTKTAMREERRARGRPKADDLAVLEARLLRVARKNFIANGYGATSMNEIAKDACVSKGTLYARFPSKADLFTAIVERRIVQSGGLSRTIKPEPGTLDALLRVFAERALRFSLSEDIIELNRLVYSESRRVPEIGQALLARSQSGTRHAVECIREYAVIDGIPCCDPDCADEMFVTLIRGFYADIMQRARPASVAEVKRWTRKTLRLFLAGRPHW